MEKYKDFKRWTISDNDLKDLNPVKARDLIIKCFHEAQKETFLKARKQLGVRSSDEDIYSSVVAGVRLTFKEFGGDFEKPTKESLTKIVGVLAKKSASWGTPEDIVEYHKKQILKVLEYLK